MKTLHFIISSRVLAAVSFNNTQLVGQVVQVCGS